MENKVKKIRAVVMTALAAVLFAGGSILAAETAEDYISKGHELYRQGKYISSLEMYEKALDLDPANAVALKYVGFIYVKSGNYEAAKKALKEAYLFSGDETIKKTLNSLDDVLVQDEPETAKTYSYLLSANVIPYIALFLNASFEACIADTIGVRVGAFSWSANTDWTGVFGQVHFYPARNGLQGWFFGGGIGYMDGGILPNAQGGYRWINDEGFSVDIMLGGILLTYSNLSEYYLNTWPSVELSLGYAF